METNGVELWKSLDQKIKEWLFKTIKEEDIVQIC